MEKEAELTDLWKPFSCGSEERTRIRKAGQVFEFWTFIEHLKNEKCKSQENSLPIRKECLNHPSLYGPRSLTITKTMSND